MRLPNGYGSVYKLSGNRRKPFIARKTIGWDEKGHPKYQIIGYYPTREAGLIALAEYNKNPYDIDASKITLKELYEQWLEKKAPKLGEANRKNLKSVYRHCLRFQNMRYRDLKSYHMQDCIDNCGCAYSTQWAIKNLFGHLDKFAMELDVIEKSYSTLLVAEPVPETSKVPFTEEEIQTVWKLKDEEWVDSVLFLLYGGWRIGEMLNMKIEDVNLENMTIIGGSKTKSGKGRVVPIHSAIQDMVKNRVSKGNGYLFSLRQHCTKKSSAKERKKQ